MNELTLEFEFDRADPHDPESQDSIHVSGVILNGKRLPNKQRLSYKMLQQAREFIKSVHAVVD